MGYGANGAGEDAVCSTENVSYVLPDVSETLKLSQARNFAYAYPIAILIKSFP